MLVLLALLFLVAVAIGANVAMTFAGELLTGRGPAKPARPLRS